MAGYGVIPSLPIFIFRQMYKNADLAGSSQKPSTSLHFDPTLYKEHLRNQRLPEPVRQDGKKKRTIIRQPAHS